MANRFHISTVAYNQSPSSASDFPIISYNLQMVRSRTDNFMPYGPILMKQAAVFVALEYNGGSKVLFERLNENEENYFAIYKDSEKILEMQAYITDIEEYIPNKDVENPNQILVKVTLLVTEINYTGQESTPKIKFG